MLFPLTLIFIAKRQIRDEDCHTNNDMNPPTKTKSVKKESQGGGGEGQFLTTPTICAVIRQVLVE